MTYIYWLLRTSSKRLTCRITWRLCNFQVRRRCYFFISSPDHPNIHQLEKVLLTNPLFICLNCANLAFLNNDETEDQQHDPSHCGKETHEDALDDSLVQVTGVLAPNTKQMASKCGVVVSRASCAGVVPFHHPGMMNFLSSKTCRVSRPRTRASITSLTMSTRMIWLIVPTLPGFVNLCWSDDLIFGGFIPYFCWYLWWDRDIVNIDYYINQSHASGNSVTWSWSVVTWPLGWCWYKS